MAFKQTLTCDVAGHEIEEGLTFRRTEKGVEIIPISMQQVFEEHKPIAADIPTASNADCLIRHPQFLATLKEMLV